MIERHIERAMYASRWILAPLSLGLPPALVAFGIKFFQEIVHVLPLSHRTARDRLGFDYSRAGG